jgi:hypothetical protein
MRAHALLRTYPNGRHARITPRDGAYLLELYDQHGRRRPDLRVIMPSLEDAQRMADDHAGVVGVDPWMPVYPDTFNVALPDDSISERELRGRIRRGDAKGR